MATSTTSFRVVAILVFALACYGASAQSLALETATAPSPAQSLAPETATAPSPAGVDCLNVLVNMSDCLTYVEDGSNLTKPDKGCCPELAGLVDSNPICLCKLLGNPDSTGIKINVNKALKLPSVCGVTTPPVSTCSAAGVPVSLPPNAMSPGSPPEGSATSPTNAAAAPGSGSPPEGSATSPTNAAAAPGSGGLSPSSNEAAASPSGNNDNGNGASGIQASALAFIFCLATVSVSIFF